MAESFNFKKLLLGYGIDLVEHDHIAPFQLRRQKIRNSAVILWTKRLSAIVQIVGAVVVSPEV